MNKKNTDTPEYEFKEISVKELIKKGRHSAADVEYMSSLSSAVLSKSSNRSRILLWLLALSIGWLIWWSSIAELDEITRGDGKVIPFGKVKTIQNLEGGIVSKFYIKEGDLVKKGQPLLKIEDIRFQASLSENKINLNELQAKEARLLAEANNTPFNPGKQLTGLNPKFILREKSLYSSNKEQLDTGVRSLKEQLSQKNSGLREIREKIRQHGKSMGFIDQEIEMKKPLVEREIVSKVELIQLNRERNDLDGEIRALKQSTTRIYSEMAEIKEKIEEMKLRFQNTAKKELNETVAEISRINEMEKSFTDRVQRTVVKSPVEGVVKQLFVNTVGGVVQPGMDILEIVPQKDTLLVEAKIKPSDIAFIDIGQKAIVKFTAYDFSIYGGLKGKVNHISADTIMDDNGQSFYTVRVKTDEDFLGNDSGRLDIKIGMRTSLDIITGKKSILTYLLKPIIKAKSNALRER